MDNPTKKLSKERDMLLAKSILEPLTEVEERRLDELKEYFDTVAEVDQTLAETQERDSFLEKEQCYSVYDY